MPTMPGLALLLPWIYGLTWVQSAASCQQLAPAGLRPCVWPWVEAQADGSCP